MTGWKTVSQRVSHDLALQQFAKPQCRLTVTALLVAGFFDTKPPSEAPQISAGFAELQ
jgi:hypothetical protein